MPSLLLLVLGSYFQLVGDEEEGILLIAVIFKILGRTLIGLSGIICLTFESITKSMGYDALVEQANSPCC